jgi:hypothetical protein
MSILGGYAFPSVALKMVQRVSYSNLLGLEAYDAKQLGYLCQAVLLSSN